MDLVQQIRHLVNQRDAAVQRAEELTKQIDHIRAALGIMLPDAAPTPVPRERRPIARTDVRARNVAMGGLSQQQILDALAQKEPLSTADLKARLPHMSTLGIHLPAMAKAKLVIRCLREGDGKRFWYARSMAAFVNSPYDFISEDGGAEAGHEVTAPA